MTNEFNLTFTISTDTYSLEGYDRGWVIRKKGAFLQDYPNLDSAFAAILSAYEWSGVTPDPELFEAIEASLLHTDSKGD